jgi:hypothetical protein
MKQICILLLVVLFNVISSKKFYYGGAYYNMDNNKIYNNAKATSTGYAINLGNKGFAQANPTAISSNSNYIA